MKKISYRERLIISVITGASLLTAVFAVADYKTVTPKPLQEDAVAVTDAGPLTRQGTYYMLTRNISSATTALFLGNNITLDLNGHTVSYADGGYQNIPNHSFEAGLQGWDTSSAPGARVRETRDTFVFIGKKLLWLPADQEIVSQYTHLPLADRSYFGMCGVISDKMRVSLSIEDERGNTVFCSSQSGDTLRVDCPVKNKRPRLGGGFIIAHLHHAPAGYYRLRIRALTDCYIDHADIRPAMDAGIAIIGKTLPYAHNDDLYAGRHTAFFDYTEPGSASKPLSSLPAVGQNQQGRIVIKNGVIRSGAKGVLSWGIQSTAENVRIVLENVRIIAAGINTNAVDVPQAFIKDCRFDIDTPFIINRHVSEHAVVLRGRQRSEVSYCDFIGGQGCLTFRGLNSRVHNNLFINRQMVTNHYCIMAEGDSSKIFRNRFLPETGSGIEIFRHKNIEIFDNTFKITASPPTCEYGHEEYSTTAIRIADYGAEAGSPRGCADNRVYGNRFHITGMDYPQFKDYIPMAWAFFHSASGGDTYVYDNDIVVEHKDPGSKAIAAAFYIGGAGNGGFWYDNRITSNVPAVWIATPYGSAKNAVLSRNHIEITSPQLKPVKIGHEGRRDAIAEAIEFRSNHVYGTDFGVEMVTEGHQYSVFWRLSVTVIDAHDNGLPEIRVSVTDREGKPVNSRTTDRNGQVQLSLMQCSVEGSDERFFSPHKVKVAGKEREVVLDRDRHIVFKLRH